MFRVSRKHVQAIEDVTLDSDVWATLQNEAMSDLLLKFGPLHGFFSAGFDRGIMQTMVGFLSDVEAYQSVFVWAPLKVMEALEFVLLYQFSHLRPMFPKLANSVFICFKLVLVCQVCLDVLLSSYV